MKNGYHYARLAAVTGLIAGVSCGCKPSAPNPPPPPPPPTTTTTTVPPSFGLIGLVRAVPVSDVYTRGSIRAEIHDGNSDPNLRFTADEKRLLYNILDVLPEANIKDLQLIGILSDKDFTPTAASAPSLLVYSARASQTASASGGANSRPGRTFLLDGVLDPSRLNGPNSRSTPLRTDVTNVTNAGGLLWFVQVTLHELGHQTEYGIQSGERKEWQTLHSYSMDNSDYAPPYEGGPDGKPYGATNEGEDFATVHAELALNPATAFLASLDVLQSKGRAVLFQKYLYMASLFADDASSKINFVTLDTQPLSAYVNPAAYQRTATGLGFQIDCAGRGASCVPFEIHMDVNSSNEIVKIDYTDPRKSGSAARVSLTPPQPIPLPQALLNRMPVPGSNASRAGTSDSATPAAWASAENAALPASESSGSADSAWAGRPDFERLMKDIGSSLVISPRLPTEYVPVTAVAPASEFNALKTPTLEDLIRPHGNFKIIPAGK